MKISKQMLFGAGILLKSRLISVNLKIFNLIFNLDLIQDMNKGLITSVKSLCGVTEDFNVGVDVHKRSALSPYLFSVVMDRITRHTGAVPWFMMSADDIVFFFFLDLQFYKNWLSPSPFFNHHNPGLYFPNPSF
jgi:hypothetical protein